jgi:hypothetical protein
VPPYPFYLCRKACLGSIVHYDNLVVHSLYYRACLHGGVTVYGARLGYCVKKSALKMQAACSSETLIRSSPEDHFLLSYIVYYSVYLISIWLLPYIFMYNFVQSSGSLNTVLALFLIQVVLQLKCVGTEIIL